MKQKLNIFGAKRVIIIFVELSKENNHFYAMSSGYKENILKSDAEKFASIDDIVRKYGASRAYWVHVSGSGVLSRLIDRSTGYKDDIIINGDKDDFLFSSYTDGEKSAVSFVRKTLVNNVLETLTKLKVILIGISAGNIPHFVLLSPDDSLEFEFKIVTKNGLISEFKRNEIRNNLTTFRNQVVSEKQFIASSIITFLNDFKSGFEFCLSDKDMAIALEEYSQRRRFTYIGVASLLLIFLIVASNYFYINFLNNQVAQLEMDLSLSNNNLTLIDQLDQEKIRKEQLIETSGLSGNKFISFYLDKIGQSVPPSIYLKEMTVFPLVEKLKDKRKVSVDTQKIEILGLTGSSVVFDDWIEKMNRLEWVKSVEVMNYSKINESQAEFKLIMFLTK
jgi:Tfp pilus assembly protein PilN